MSKPLHIETTRTILRPFRLTDATEAHRWFSDVEVMRFIPSPPDKSEEETAVRIRRYMAHEQQHGFSKWVIEEKDSGRLIGDCGLYTMPDGVRVELGYRLARPYWGLGLATEISRAWLEHVKMFTHQPVIHAFANPDNAASLHVIQKLGFQYSHHETVYGWNAPVYVMEL